MKWFNLIHCGQLKGTIDSVAGACLSNKPAGRLAGGPDHSEGRAVCCAGGPWLASRILEENTAECSSWQVMISPHFLLNMQKEKDC